MQISKFGFVKYLLSATTWEIVKQFFRYIKENIDLRVMQINALIVNKNKKIIIIRRRKWSEILKRFRKFV